MRPATIYYLAQAWSPRTNHQFQRDDAPPSPRAGAATRGHLAATVPGEGCRPSRAASLPC